METDNFNDLADMDIKTYTHGDLTLIAAICRKIGIRVVVDQAVESRTSQFGRPSDISYGLVAEILLTIICTGHHPLYRIRESLEDKDIEGIFKESIPLESLTDDRFARLLDRVHEMDPAWLYSQIRTKVLEKFGIEIKSINYDTTSRIMWGEYETLGDGDTGVVKIEFGHSKDRRPDKKQVKVGIGVSDGVVVDANVMDGSKDDKTFNADKLDRMKDLAESLSANLEDLNYIADAAFFTKRNLAKAKEHGVSFIARAPDNLKVCRNLVDLYLQDKQGAVPVSIENTQSTPSNYSIKEYIDSHHGHECKFVVCESDKLRKQKEKIVAKKVSEEKEILSKQIKPYTKIAFQCEEDARNELKRLEKEWSRLKFHEVTASVIKEEKRGRGRPGAIPKVRHQYRLDFSIEQQEELIDKHISRESTFVLATNNKSLSGEEVLREYKTQSNVESRFRQFKSPEFANAIYLKTPGRVAALMYFMLMALTILSAIEVTVRKELAKKGEAIRGPGGVKTKRPTFRSILLIMRHGISVLYIEGRRKIQSLRDSHRRILEILGLDTGIFTLGPSNA
ncbi:MAG TPA: IS1634 family transposase [Nitrososphaera sp.]|nr:IS1634 family transposase [Nitrososphaera sp.]